MELMSAAAAVMKSIRIQDVLDMAIIAAMIFALLMWFKTRASRYVLVGILLLGGVYLAARFFQLYLTVIVLQGFFAILLFVLVVIFQEDLRSFFERIAMLGNLRREARPLSELEKAAGVIAETSSNLAKKRIGALIVIQGNDPLDRHLNGGTPLDGLISGSLLESIFDPHSLGHDGAVLVCGDRIKMFGYQRDIVRRDVIIPLEYKNIPQSWQIDEPRLTEVKVIFQGPEQAFRLLNEKSLRLSLDLSPIAEKKREFVLTQDMVNVPSSLSVADISPAKIRVYASRLVPATLAVHVATRNRLPEDIALQRITLSPATVRVMMDSRMKSEDMKLETEPIDLQNISSSLTMEAKVIQAAGVSFPDGKSPLVRVTIRVKKK
ncbi:MAG: hypothetical protein FD159_1203 [Syntrophaceae bacterium]|nr:MAG: hypothetical protein FD159_1203 [Syntrophaceae bacterium]